MTADHQVLVIEGGRLAIAAVSHISRFKQRGIDGVASRIRAWPAGTQ